MPKGVPVATFAIGEAGAANAALTAIAIIATANDDYGRALAKKLEDFRTRQSEKGPGDEAARVLRRPMDIAPIRDYFTGLQDRIIGELEARRRPALPARRLGAPARRRRHLAPDRGRQSCSSAAASTSRTSWASRCPPRPPPTAPNWPDGAGRRWASRWCMHPRNPYCPTAHMNVRFFVA
jgi:hypothetical protein